MTLNEGTSHEMIKIVIHFAEQPDVIMTLPRHTTFQFVKQQVRSCKRIRQIRTFF
jgi:hypothetical protein